MFESSLFGPGQSPFMDLHSTGLIEHQAPEPKRPRGPIIEELNSDDEKEEPDNGMKGNPRKHGRSDPEPYVEVPDDEAEQSGRRNRHLQYVNGYNSSYQRQQQQQQPQTHSFTFQSSTVTYGGMMELTILLPKQGGLEVMELPSRKAKKLTQPQGHSVMRKLNSDGRVNTMQTLHNLNEGKSSDLVNFPDELAGFEESWNGKAQKHMPGWVWQQWTKLAGRSERMGASSTEHSQPNGRLMLDARDREGPSRSQHSIRMKGSTDLKDQSSQSRGKRKD
ncbi:DHHC-type zinc finger family protein [Hibiscus syriacus]|uniref:DHHC-type zinc finger family protein n=1 Tax=Hibiscus syriacus TaxID=106335 RepID=A0A6A3CTY1_HIBSY|nr:DHHC-type zinc finger family protein [Hibiscus syriacus]